MPATLYIHVKSGTPIRLQPYTSSGLGWLLALLYRKNPDLSAALHDANAVKPFSLSTWLAITDDAIEAERSGEPLALHAAPNVHPGTRVSLRVAAAHPEIIAAILSALHSGDHPPLSGTAVAAVDYPAKFDQCVSVDCFDCPWEALLAAPPANRINLRFASPTAFSSQGRDILLPEANRMLESWQSKWHAWGGPTLVDAAPNDLASAVMVESYDLATSVHGHGNARNRGFSGTLSWRIAPGTPSEIRCLIAALAGFSNFCGTGAKTNFGFGQTRAQVS